MSDTHRRQRGSWFCGTTKCLADIENVKKHVSEFHYYAYCTHKPDDDDDRLHIHYVVLCNGTRTLGSVADTLDVDGQYIQVCKTPRGANRYLIHLDNPEKEQYPASDVVTNNLDMFKMFLSDNQKINAVDFFNDLKLLRSRRITSDQFVQKYEFQINKLPFYQRIKTMEVIMKFGE